MPRLPASVIKSGYIFSFPTVQHGEPAISAGLYVLHTAAVSNTQNPLKKWVR